MPFTLADSSIYTDGKNLSTWKHNYNIYHKQTQDRGVYTKLNGGLHAGDFRPEGTDGSTFGRPQIWPGLLVDARTESSLTPLEFFSTAGSVGSSNGNEGYTPIPGTSIRFYQPYDCKLALFDFTTYMSPFRPYYVDDRMYYGEGDDGVYDNADTMHTWTFWTRLVIDGQAYGSSYMRVPLSAAVSPSERFAGHEEAGSVQNHEYLQGYCWTQHVQKANLEKGWHHAQLEHRMATGGSSVYVAMKRGKKELDTSLRYYQRLFAGIRNVRVLTLT